jgi:uncharacterized Zn finger protein (UPF0148 family)
MVHKHNWTYIGPAGTYCPECGIFYDTYLKEKEKKEREEKEKIEHNKLKKEIDDLKIRIEQLEKGG